MLISRRNYDLPNYLIVFMPSNVEFVKRFLTGKTEVRSSLYFSSETIQLILFRIYIKPSTGISIEPLEVKGKPPLTSKLNIKTSRAGDYTVKVKISGKGEVLEERTLNLRVKGKWRERVITIEDVEKIGEGVKVLHMEVHDLLAVPDVVKVAEEFGGLLDGKIVFLNEENKDYLRIDVNTNDPRVLKLLWGSINSLARISGRGKVNVDLKLHVEGEPELKNIASRLTNPGFFRFKVKERADGESGV